MSKETEKASLNNQIAELNNTIDSLPENNAVKKIEDQIAEKIMRDNGAIPAEKGYVARYVLDKMYESANNDGKWVKIDKDLM